MVVIVQDQTDLQHVSDPSRVMHFVKNNNAFTGGEEEPLQPISVWTSAAEEN